MELSVLSLNTWQERGPWQNRWNIILAEIERLKPDVIAFQEVFNADWAEKVRELTRKQTIVLSRDHSSGLVLLSGFPALEGGVTQYRTKSPLEDYHRYFLKARLQTPAGPLCFMNTHLSWKPEDTHVRRAQVEELIQNMPESSSEPVIITGDFNSDDHTEEIRLMLEKGAAKDAYASVPQKDPGMTWCHRNPYTHTEFNKLNGELLPERRIDYVFFRPGRLSVRLAEVVCSDADEENIWASDHFGVFVQFELTPA